MPSDFTIESLKLHNGNPDGGSEADSAHEHPDNTFQATSKIWRDTFNAMSEALCILDTDFRILLCNRAMTELVNQTEAEIIGKPCWEVVHGTDRPIENCPCHPGRTGKPTFRIVRGSPV